MKVHVILRESLDVLTSFGDGGRQPGQFFAVHSIATDSQGNIYTKETYEVNGCRSSCSKAWVESANRTRVWSGQITSIATGRSTCTTTLVDQCV